VALEWYIVRVLTNREERVRENLVRRIKADALEHRIPQVLVPVEKVAQVRGGKKRVSSSKLYPGYLLLQADLGDWDGADRPKQPEDQKVWFALHETPGFGDFVGGQKPPAPMTHDEVEGILQRIESSEESPRMAVTIKRGDQVRIKEGPFEGFDGTVEELVEGRGQLRISLTIFGRATSVEIDHWQVEPV
jgi:transcriptional antiterminator NusG